MTWQPEVDEIHLRRRLALKLGGEERVGRQHALGKLTIRERIDAIADHGSFHEIGGLAGQGTYEQGQLVDFSPAAYVGGLATVDGRRVVVGGSDFTVHGGASAGSIQRRSKGLFFEDMAREYRAPLIHFIESAAANVAAEGDGHGHLPSSFDVFGPLILAGQEVPVVLSVPGPAAGGAAALAVLGHFTVMTPEGSLFAAGPPVVERALGHKVTKDELGGPDIHVGTSGALDNRAVDELDALRQMKAFLSYMPSNVYEQPPVRPSSDPPDREEQELLSIVPRRRTRAYRMLRVVELIVDDGEFFEIKPEFGPSVHTLFARVGGYPVGIVANNPHVLAGAMSADSADKQGHFVELCDHFHIPIVFLADVPGFMLGPQAERTGTLRHGMRAYWATYLATVPIFTVITRKNFRHGGAGDGQRGPGQLPRRLAVGRLGIDPDRGRRRGGLQARDRGRARPRRQAPRDRGAPAPVPQPLPHRGGLRHRRHHRPAPDALVRAPLPGVGLRDREQSVGPEGQGGRAP